MRGLDPRIHPLANMMDGRVKPGHDDGVVNVLTMGSVPLIGQRDAAHSSP
jgi:hypothetical protein